MHNKICEFCEKPFTANHENTKYCSDACRKAARIKKDKERYIKRKNAPNRLNASKAKRRTESICWHCKNACGGCDWSRHLIPVKGWKAKEVKNVGYSAIKSYKVIECPEFEEGR